MFARPAGRLGCGVCPTTLEAEGAGLLGIQLAAFCCASKYQVGGSNRGCMAPLL